MNRKGIQVLSLALVLTAALGPVVWAESHEEPTAPPSFIYIWTDHVPLADAGAYAAEVKKVLAKMAETEEGKQLQFFAIQGAEGVGYGIPMADLSEFMKKSMEWQAATNAVGGMEVWDGANKYVDHGSGVLIVLRSDISYTPAEPRPEEESGMYRWHEWWFVKPGHEAAIEDVARRFAALYKEKGIDTGWRVYQAVTGPDLPLYVVANTATNAADYHANDARVAKELGDAVQELIQEAMSHARRVEHSSSMIRPDLSMGM